MDVGEYDAAAARGNPRDEVENGCNGRGIKIVRNAFPNEDQALATAQAAGGKASTKVVAQKIDWHVVKVSMPRKALAVQTPPLGGEKCRTIHLKDGQIRERRQAERAAVETGSQDHYPGGPRGR